MDALLTYQTFVWYLDRMPKTPPGRTRERVYDYVRRRLYEGRPPTVRDVQRAFRFRAVETARGHLDVLVNEGRLLKRSGEARGLELPELSARGASPPRLVPILGRVQAGALSTAIEDLEGYVPITPGTSPHTEQEHFALRVRGESMRGAGIFPNDLVVVRRQSTATSGEIVVALVEDEATVKRLRLRKGRIELHPENPDFEVIVLQPKETPQSVILGKVVEVRRLLDPSLVLDAPAPG